MRTIWSTDEAEFHGAQVDFGPIVSRPRPQTPIPIYVGGSSAAALSRTARLADGWLPLAPGTTPADIEKTRAWFTEQGRADLGVTVTEVPDDAAFAAAYLGAGVDRTLFHLEPGKQEDVLRNLDRIARTVSRVLDAH